MDEDDKKQQKERKNAITPSNTKKIPDSVIAVAVKDALTKDDLPQITAAGRGKIAEQILQLAFDNDIKVREDAPLAEMLASVELDSPIPSEAFMAVAEILSYVYRANGEPNPFDTVFDDITDDDMNDGIDETEEGQK